MKGSDAPNDLVEISRPGGNLVARVVVPSIGHGEAQSLRDAIGAQLAEGAAGRAMVLDFSQVSLVSSLGLGTVVDLRNAAEKLGMRPGAHGLNRHLTELFALMRIDRLFTVTRSQAELERFLAG
jgi:anti-anti-sigma regulatory factor